MDLLIWAAVFFLLSFYFSGIETAFTSFDRILLESWKRHRKVGAGIVRFLIKNPDRFLNTSLIGTNISNVAFASLIVMWSERSGLPPGYVLVLSPVFVLIFAELIPKVLAYGFGNLAVRILSLPLFLSFYLLAPVRLLLKPILHVGVVKRKEKTEDSAAARFVRKELEIILMRAHVEGAVSPEERKILSRYLDLRERKVRQVMTPRTEMDAVDINVSMDDVRKVFKETGRNLLMVYENDLDHLIGFLFAADFLQEVLSLQDVLHPVSIVPESKPVVELLVDFRSGAQVVGVVDEHGGIEGIVTITDIIDEIVGSSIEGWDIDVPVIKKMGPTKYLAAGTAELDDLAERIGCDFPEGDYSTLSGLLSARLGRIGEVGEQIEFDGVIIRILRRSPRRVEACLLTIVNQTEDNR